MALQAERERYTFAGVLRWDGNERVEIIDGEAVMMGESGNIGGTCSPVGKLSGWKALQGFPCAIWGPAFEADGEPPENVDTLVEPDISVVCDKSKLDRHGCRGAPDFIAEILSPSSLRHDRLVKLELYQKAGAREYWIVDLEYKSVQVFLFCKIAL